MGKSSIPRPLYKPVNEKIERMNKIIYSLLFALLLLGGVDVSAQTTVDAKLEPTALLIGEQAHLTVKVTADAGVPVAFPSYKGRELMKGVEVLNETPADTSWLNGDKRLVITKVYTVTSFDSSLYYLPPIIVTAGGKKVASRQGIGLKVSTVSIDTAHVDQCFGPKSVAPGIFEWSSLWLWLSLLLVLLVVGVVVLFYRSAGKIPMMRRRIILPPEPPHVLAKKQIENIKESPQLRSADSKQYYMALTDVLRSYIEQRFQFSAKEMTSQEIIERLMRGKNEESLSELRQIFATADLVKFAKYEAQLNENDSNLLKALDFVNNTKVEPTAPPKPIIEEIPVDKKKQMMLRILMKTLAIIGILLAFLLLYLIGDQVYKSFL